MSETPFYDIPWGQMTPDQKKSVIFWEKFGNNNCHKDFENIKIGDKVYWAPLRGFCSGDGEQYVVMVTINRIYTKSADGKETGVWCKKTGKSLIVPYGYAIQYYSRWE